MGKTIWQLRGSTDKVVECSIDRTIATAHAVTVVLGHETFLREIYPDEAGALGRAAQVRERLLKSGGWTLIADVAERRSSR